MFETLLSRLMKNKPKAFLIEDSDILAELISFELKRNFNCDVITFKNGDNIISDINYNMPDVIILDYNFNDNSLKLKNGQEVLVCIRRLFDIPVILFSGQKNKSKSKELLDAGANCYISKDDDEFMEDLMSFIENTLRIKQS
jgi:DNA-binding NarL/FixJ family response regulator